VSELEKVGRLALRVEGSLWCAYYALANTTDGALFLGSIRVAFVEERPERRAAFMELMREAVALRTQLWSSPESSATAFATTAAGSLGFIKKRTSWLRANL
jgi:hypothetical protein